MIVIFIALCIAAIACDLRHRKIPNVLIGIGLLVPLLVSGVTGSALMGISPAHALTGSVIGLLSLLPFYAIGKMGAGDVKFLAVLGAWLGPEPLLVVFVIASLIAAVQALLMLIARAVAAPHVDIDIDVMTHPVQATLRHWRFAGRGIPYAAWLATGALVWFAFAMH